MALHAQDHALLTELPSAALLSNTPPSRRPTTKNSSSSPNLGFVTSSFLRRSSSTSSIPSTKAGESLKAKALPHVDTRLESKQYKSISFTSLLLDILRTLRVPSWQNAVIVPDVIKIHKVSGSLTNAVFFVSCPSHPHTRTVLLRVYGPSSGSLISRPRELHILHVLSSVYGIGPCVYGTFGNGRVEEYFDSVTLSPADIRDWRISRWVGARMAELHSVDSDVVMGSSKNNNTTGGKGQEIGVTKNVQSWLAPARDVVALPVFPPHHKEAIDLDAFTNEWNEYMRWLAAIEKTEGASRRVFAHNDAQYGNLLRLTNFRQGSPEHRQIVVVDFEYASLNPAAFDIANHFLEWTSNYDSATPHVLDPKLYPTREERRNFYAVYLKHVSILERGSSTTRAAPPDEQGLEEMELLDRQVAIWRPASHGMWAIWSLVQAREMVESPDGAVEFDYVAYASGRVRLFRQQIKELGIIIR